MSGITGTAGQVLANGNAATVEVGVVTLTLSSALTGILSVDTATASNLVLKYNGTAGITLGASSAVTFAGAVSGITTFSAGGALFTSDAGGNITATRMGAGIAANGSYDLATGSRGVLFGAGLLFSGTSSVTSASAQNLVLNTNSSSLGITLASATGAATFGAGVAAINTTSGTVIISGSGGLGVGGKAYFGDSITLSPNGSGNSLLIANVAGNTHQAAVAFQVAGSTIWNLGLNADGTNNFELSNHATSDVIALGVNASTNLVTVLNSLTMSGTLTGAATLTGTNSITSASATDLVLTGNAGSALTLTHAASTASITGGAAGMNFLVNANGSFGAGTALLTLSPQGTTDGNAILAAESDSGTQGAKGLYIYSNSIAVAKILGAGALSSASFAIRATTTASSTTSGALQVAGGGSVQGALYVGGTINFSGGTLAGPNGTTIVDSSGNLNITAVNSSSFINLVSSSTGGVKVSVGGALQWTFGPVGLSRSDSGNVSYTPGAVGSVFSIGGQSGLTDATTAMNGTTALAVVNSFAVPTLKATNTGVITGTAATVYIAGSPVAGTNQTLTNSYGLWNAGKTLLGDALVIGTSSSSLTVSSMASTAASGFIQSTWTIDSTGTPHTFLAGIQASGGAFLGSSTNDAVVIRQNNGAALTIDTSKGITIAGTVDSTNTTSGSGIFGGGVGIAKALSVGTTVMIGSTAILTNVQQTSGILQLSSTAGTSIIGLKVLTNKSSSSYGAYLELDSASITNGRDWYIMAAGDNDAIGAGPLGFLDATAGVTALKISGGAVGVGTISTPYTTASTSISTGALTLSATGAGLGVAGNIISGGGIGWGVTSTATAATTTTLTVASTAVQIFTGSTTQSIQLPAANVMGAGTAVLYVIKNRSLGSVTILRAGSDTIDGGVTSYILNTFDSITLVSNGVNEWELV